MSSNKTVQVNILPPLQTANVHDLGLDLGQIKNSFDPSGQFTMNNEYGQSLIISPISINGLIQSPFGNSINYNSTLTQFVFGTLSENFVKLSNGFNISIVGSLPFAEPISITIPKVTSNCDMGNDKNGIPFCTSVQSGYEYFDWSDSLAYNPTWNNQTNTLTWNILPSQISNINIDPIAVDGSAKCSTGVFNSCLATLTTTNTNDIIIVVTSCVSGGGNCVGSSAPTDTSGLIWNYRASNVIVAQTTSVTEYYALATSALTGDIVNITSQNSNARVSGNVFAVSGTNSLDPFDSNFSLPCVSNGVSTSPLCTINTSQVSDVIIGMLGAYVGFITCTPIGIFSTIVSECGDSNGNAVSEIRSASTILTGLSVGWTLSSSATWVMIADALTNATSGSTTTTTTSTVFTSTTTSTSDITSTSTITSTTSITSTITSTSFSTSNIGVVSGDTLLPLSYILFVVWLFVTLGFYALFHREASLLSEIVVLSMGIFGIILSAFAFFAGEIWITADNLTNSVNIIIQNDGLQYYMGTFCLVLGMSFFIGVMYHVFGSRHAVN